MTESYQNTAQKGNKLESTQKKKPSTKWYTVSQMKEHTAAA